MIDIDDLEKALIDIPDWRMNPIINEDDGTTKCVYTSLYNPVVHCIAGQLAVNFNWQLPDIETTDNYLLSASRAAEVYHWDCTPAVVDIINRLQVFADAETMKGNEVAWGRAKEQVISMIEARRLKYQRLGLEYL